MHKSILWGAAEEEDRYDVRCKQTKECSGHETICLRSGLGAKTSWNPSLPGCKAFVGSPIPAAWLASRQQPASLRKGPEASLPHTNLTGSVWKQMG